MKNKKIIIAGGSGFLGRSLAKYWSPDNQLIILSREQHINAGSITYLQWDGQTLGEWAAALEGADLLVNLSGKSVNCRYNEANKKAIFDSRTFSTQVLGQAVLAAKNPPKVWINAASATIYRHAEDHPMDEFNGEIANDFSVQVCKKWEQTFNDLSLPQTRKAILRIGVTLGSEPGGVMQPYCNLVKFGLGGQQGNGLQKYTWVHAEDVAGMMAWIAENPTLDGTFNCTSPNPVNNRIFMATLRKAAGHYFGLPAAAWMLAIGARLIGTETELLLKSRWVLPTRALQCGYNFRYPLLEPAIRNILSEMTRSSYHLF
ncbi:TIGR01777 family oxidoreductase [Chitinophaga sp. Cy-1792]|uniref:TIGR01777 family oxidoreductase n=1 Tax=Chitinophaga sp. Cy-1792 TaxID=2608339 RepID=UPI001423BBD8|nr:TIGR01777 family oxidoreductase [Chitinophaga sp. Cy-1792]NIG53118.1 TIGR01777 family protein [Chitinophaga sp. Cy-1792]